jgi:hypothetical protein
VGGCPLPTGSDDSYYIRIIESSEWSVGALPLYPFLTNWLPRPAAAFQHPLAGRRRDIFKHPIRAPFLRPSQPASQGRNTYGNRDRTPGQMLTDSISRSPFRTDPIAFDIAAKASNWHFTWETGWDLVSDIRGKVCPIPSGLVGASRNRAPADQSLYIRINE